jgi:hypothetical protein
LYSDIDGISGKHAGFYSDLDKLNPSIFCLTETWHTKSIDNFFFNKYAILENFGNRLNNLGRHSLGYIIGIRPGIVYEVISKDNYYCVVLLKLEKQIIIFAYLPPDNVNIFPEFANNVEKITKRFTHHKIILMGDLNARISSFQLGESYETEQAGSRDSKDTVINPR